MVRRLLSLVSLSVLLGSVGCVDSDGRVPVDPIVLEALEQRGAGIVGGSTVNNDWESVVLLYGGGGICTGTVISSDVVLTASHCLDGVHGTMEVYWGDNLSSGWADHVRYSNDYHMHPHYNPNTMIADIAVVVMTQNSPTPAHAINKDSPAWSWLGDPLQFVGFGVTAGWANDSQIKREVEIGIDEWDGTFLYYYGSQQQTCFGDSGGPAFTDHQGSWKVAGVTSYGDENCNQYGADIRVDSYASWIEGYTGGSTGDDDDFTPGDDDDDDDDDVTPGDDDDDVTPGDDDDDDTPHDELPPPRTSGAYDVADGMTCIGDHAPARPSSATLALLVGGLALVALRRR